MKLLITNIQRFSLNDGPGIRTTVFLKGCSIRCPWCCNPETQLTYPEIFFNKKLCLREKNTKCQLCINNISSPEEYLQHNNLENVVTEYSSHFNELCPTKALGIYGKEVNIEELLTIFKKDEIYFRNTGGGVTFSGGEPLLYDLSPWFQKIKSLKYHICLETSLYASANNLKKLIDFVDLWIVDIKILSPDKAQKILKGDLQVFLKNVELLIKFQKNNVLFRFPIVNGYTNTEENLDLLFLFIKSFNIKQLEIFTVHNLAIEKYLSLGRKYENFPKTKKEDIIKIKEQIEEKTLCEVNILDI